MVKGHHITVIVRILLITPLLLFLTGQSNIDFFCSCLKHFCLLLLKVE